MKVYEKSTSFILTLALIFLSTAGGFCAPRAQATEGNLGPFVKIERAGGERIDEARLAEEEGEGLFGAAVGALAGAVGGSVGEAVTNVVSYTTKKVARFETPDINEVGHQAKQGAIHGAIKGAAGGALAGLAFGP